ncbi:MAG: phage tail tape measure protein [Treponema sp.]
MGDFNIGNIYAELSMDTTRLEASKRNAIKELGNLRDEGEKILKESGGKMTEAMKIRLEEIEKNKKDVLKALDELNKNIREKLNPQKEVLGSQIEAAFMAPLKQFASASLDTFSQFQQSMQNTFSVMGASSSEMKLLEDAAKKMGESTRFSASQASNALYALGSAGQSASEAVNSLQGVLRLAGATGAELGFTSETVAATLSQFNLQANKASHIADVYSKAISKSQANITKLAYSMKYVGPVASGLGISLETTTAALMKLYNTGYGGEQAGTYLKQAFQKLASGTQDLKNKLQELGLSYNDVNPQTRNFADIINTLKEKNIGITESIAIFGETAGGAMAKLIEEGGDAIATMEGLLKSSEGSAEEMQKIQNASFANTKAELLSAMEAVQITTGSILEPAMNTLAQGFTEILKTINGLPIGVQTFITTMAGASTAIVPFLTMPALITRIKKSMDLLNVSMLKSPIFLAGAVVTTVAALTYSIIQQRKKEMQDLIQDASKGVEDIKEMQKKAQEAGEKGRSIQGLLDQYESLKSKTNKTKEEQEAYNNTLQKLTELVPDVVSKIGKTGEAYIENIEKIKRASFEQLKLEAELNKQSIAIAQQRKANALTVQSLMSNKIEDVKKQRAFYADSIKHAQELTLEILEAEKKGKEAVDEILKREYGESVFDGPTQERVPITYKERYAMYKSDSSSWLEFNKKLLKEEEETLQIQLDVQKSINDLNELMAKQNTIENTLNTDQKEKAKQRSKDEIIKAMIGKEGSIKKALDAALYEAKKYGESLDAVDEEIRIIKDRLKEIYSISPEDLKEGVAFNFEDKAIRPLYNRLEELEKIKANRGKGATGAKAKKEDDSLDAHLQKIDEKYERRIKIAEEYGHDIVEVEKKWHEERKAELARHVKDINNLTEEEKKSSIAPNKTDGRQAITIGDELKKTENIALGFIAKSKKAYEEKKRELEKVLSHINEAKQALKKAENTKDKSEKDIENITHLNTLIQDLQGKAKSLSEELGKDYVLLADIDAKISELDVKDTNSFTSKLESIRKVKEATIKSINDALKTGNIDDKTAEKKKKEIEKAALRSTALVGVELSKTILSIGNNVTDIILGAIEKGNLSLTDALNIVSQIGNQLAEMIPDPVTKAILGAVQLGIGLISKIINYVDTQSNKLEEERKKRREEEERKSKDDANKLAGDSAVCVAKQTQAVKQGFLNYKKMMDEMSNTLQQNHINNVLKKMGTEKSLYKEERSDIRVKKAGWFFGLGQQVSVGYEKYIYEYNFTINELAKKIQEAKKKGDAKLQEKLEKLYKESIDYNLKKAGIDPSELNSINNHLQGLESAFVDAVKNKDMSRLKYAMKEKIREAMWVKLQETVITARLKPLFKELENASEVDKESIFKKILKESEEITSELEKNTKRIIGNFGMVADELEEHGKAWIGLKTQIKDALSNSLGDAAYNADWGSFKKAFAAEMRKAIISSTIANAKVKTKIDNIIKKIMHDGNIMSDEINDSIHELQGIYDNMEGKMAGLSKITKSLEGGVDVKHENSGTVIQQLSGADRDYFAELFKANFLTLAEGFKGAMIDLKEIHSAQITVLNATLTVRDININTESALNLKELIAEMIEEARKAG